MIKHSAVYYFYSAMPPGWLNLLFAVILQSLGLRDGQAEAQRAVDRLHHSSFPQILMHEKTKTAHCRRADLQTTGVFCCTCGSVWWYTVKTAWMHEYFISFLILKSTLIKFNNISVVLRCGRWLFFWKTASVFSPLQLLIHLDEYSSPSSFPLVFPSPPALSDPRSL